LAGKAHCAKLLAKQESREWRQTIEIGLAPEGVQGMALKRANRHGLIAGATGTGKTVTLQVLAEAFAREGVNVFAADIKGDLSGCAAMAIRRPAGPRPRRRNQSCR
jgi:Cdc6-like AAA superfamily ATPase